MLMDGIIKRMASGTNSNLQSTKADESGQVNMLIKPSIYRDIAASLGK